MTFVTGPNDENDLTDDQILTQCKMYIAAVRIADDFGCDLIGIQYQQGLKDLLPASDLVEGTLNNTDRPPVKSRDGKRVLYDGEPLLHFNEVDECAGLDGLMTYRVHKAMGQPVENTLHDVRWGDWDRVGHGRRLRLGLPDQRLGAAGPFHRRLEGRLQRAAAGHVLPPRRRHAEGHLQAGRDRLVADLRREGQAARWTSAAPAWSSCPRKKPSAAGRRPRRSGRSCTPSPTASPATRSWPGTRPTTSRWSTPTSAEEADKALLAKAAMADAMGMEVAICGTRKNGRAWA